MSQNKRIDRGSSQCSRKYAKDEFLKPFLRSEGIEIAPFEMSTIPILLGVAKANRPKSLSNVNLPLEVRVQSRNIFTRNALK